jgi:hypothetical protein
MTLYRRNWRGEKLIGPKEISTHPEVPLDRSAWTWGQWLKKGIEVDGALRVIPVKAIGKRLYTSIEAILEAIGDATDSQLPTKKQ